MKSRVKNKTSDERPRPEIINRQRRVKIDCGPFHVFADEVLNVVAEAEGLPFTVAFVSDAKMRQLNREFRGKDSTTDVLSFPYIGADIPGGHDFLGDIAISIEQAKRQARANKMKLSEEIKQLILHGVLHLCGYDHESDDGEMNRLELKLRRKLKI